MKSFAQEYLDSLKISHRIVQSIRLLGEHRVKYEYIVRDQPDVLSVLYESTLVQSTEASNLISGIAIHPKRLVGLIERTIHPDTIPERKIAGYYHALDTIHESHQFMRLSSSLILQFHRDLYRYISPNSGMWRKSDDIMLEQLVGGDYKIKFKSVAAQNISSHVEKLIEGYIYEHNKGEVEPLILIAAFIFDFISIHPFNDANSRISRLLMQLLLYQAGYSVGCYVSLEQIMCDSYDDCKKALKKSSIGWEDSKHDLTPWFEYFFERLLLSAFENFEREMVETKQLRGGPSQLILQAIESLPEEFTIGQIMEIQPESSRTTVKRVLARLREEDKIVSTGKGRDASWRKTVN